MRRTVNRASSFCGALLAPQSFVSDRRISQCLDGDDDDAPDHSHRLSPPTPARCRDSIVAGNFPTVEKIFAGAVCALTHGMSRWSDLQRTSNLSLTKDAITGKAGMQNQKSATLLAAPKNGVSRVDWVTP